MPPPIEGVSLTGQVIIITGANSGLGYEAAKHFAIRGPGKLVLVCRDEERGQEALNRLKTETKFKEIELWIMDLASFDSVKAIKERVDKLERLDILVENAGVTTLKYDLTPDGWERSLQVNLISTALHMILHIPKMLETAKKYRDFTPRIVVVSSGTHYWSTIPNEAIDAPNSLIFLNEESYALELLKSVRRYPETKLLATFLPRMFQSHLSPSSEPTITCVNVGPGFCHSELTREITDGNVPQEMVERFRKDKEELAFTSEEGSRQLLYAAIGQRDKEEELRGGFVAFNKVTECSDWILGEDGQRFEKKLWGELVDIIGKADKTAKGIIEQYLS
ncbi:short-chain dehydrogenase [Marasmius fiardii PR-910]|nr:short-chain dehydrogenase [Marasmius fiardii PR-910]